MSSSPSLPKSSSEVDSPSNASSQPSEPTSSPSSPTIALSSELRQNLQLRQLSSTIMNHLQWINDFSPTAIFQNFLQTNPFRRRNSTKQMSDNTNQIQTNHIEFEANDKPFARLLNGTLIPTAKSIEFIELANFGIVEIDDSERGVGHHFEQCDIRSPTWCDSCGDFLWTPVVNDKLTNSVSTTDCAKYLQCLNCKYICHLKCLALVRIDCQGVAETPYLLQKLSRPSSPLFCETSKFKSKIAKYNEKRRSKGSGLGITLLDEEKQTFRGFLRVNLNLTRPINVISGRRPPSIYDIINEEETNGTIKRRTLTSFYMPRDTVKNIHITSENTSLHVIKAMLKKFKVVDNPQKFALYLRSDDPVTDLTVLKRIGDHEKPLLIQLECDEDVEQKLFVLQENDTADINWNAFEIPELNNFLKILDREEKEHLTQVILRYKLLRDNINKIIQAEQQFN